MCGQPPKAQHPIVPVWPPLTPPPTTGWARPLSQGPLFLKSLWCSHPKPKERCQPQIGLRPGLRAQRHWGRGIRPACSCWDNSGRPVRPARLLGCPHTGPKGLEPRGPLGQQPEEHVKSSDIFFCPANVRVPHSPPDIGAQHLLGGKEGPAGLTSRGVTGGVLQGCKCDICGAILERAPSSSQAVWPWAWHAASLSLGLLQ